MKCSLIQQLLDAKQIIDQSHNLSQVILTSGDHQYTVKDWFIHHPQVRHQLQLKSLNYAEIKGQLNRAMANLF